MITRYNINDKEGNSDLDTTENKEGNWMWAEDVLLVEEHWKANERGLKEEIERLKEIIEYSGVDVDEITEALSEAKEKK